MPLSKNLSPKKLSALTALIHAAAIALGLFIFNHSWLWSLCSFFIIFIGSYILILGALQTFIYRKIKLIYKLIHQTKATKREEFYNKNILPQKGIDEVREDVERWALQRKKQIEDLERNDQYRKEFLQNLSHELKTPIFAMQGYVDTLLDGALYNENVNKKFLQSTSRNITRLASLVEDLDEISKLESGAQPLHMQQFVIQELVREVSDSFYLQAKEKNLSFTIKKGCEVPVQVFADKEKIRQVISNFVENAVKYTGQNGLIEASFYNMDDNTILVEISDNGFGIAEEHLPRIFERFYRTDLARSRKIGGSGLGLKHLQTHH